MFSLRSEIASPQLSRWVAGELALNRRRLYYTACRGRLTSKSGILSTVLRLSIDADRSAQHYFANLGAQILKRLPTQGMQGERSLTGLSHRQIFCGCFKRIVHKLVILGVADGAENLRGFSRPVALVVLRA